MSDHDIEQRLRAFAAEPATGEGDWEDVLRRISVKPVSAARHWSKWSPSRRVLIAAAVAILLLGVGTAIAAVTIARDGAPVQFAPTTGTTPSLGDDAASIIAAVKERVPDVLSIRLSNDAIPDETGKRTTDYLIAHIDIKVSADNGPQTARAMWESDLVVGALFTAFTQANLAPPFSDDVTLVLPDGTKDRVGGGLGKVVPNQIFDPVTSEIQARIRQNATAQGFSNVHVSTFQVVNDVIDVYATASDSPAVAASQFFKSHGLDALLGQSENDFEGVYFQLDDAHGNPILIESTAPRAGAGGYWAARSTGIQGDNPRVLGR